MGRVNQIIMTSRTGLSFFAGIDSEDVDETGHEVFLGDILQKHSSMHFSECASIPQISN